MIFLIIGLLVGGAAVVFILQNVVTISVHLFSWELQGSLALILIVAILTGAILSALSFLPDVFRNYFEITSLKKRIQKLEADADQYKKNIEELSKKSGIISEPKPTEPPTIAETINNLL